MIGLLMMKHLKGFCAENILDVGPGYGDFSRIAAKATDAKKITYIDFDPKVLGWQQSECAKYLLDSQTLSVELTTEGLKGISESFDLILCQELLEHLTNAEEVLGELVKKLNSNGQIVITVPTKISEQWIKLIYPQYMAGDVHGHVRMFDKRALLRLARNAGLEPVAFIPTQPHYFIAHTWMFGSRMQVDGASGKVITKDIRNKIAEWLLIGSLRFFKLTGIDFWGRLIPRNYFLIAERSKNAGSL